MYFLAHGTRGLPARERKFRDAVFWGFGGVFLPQGGFFCSPGGVFLGGSEIPVLGDFLGGARRCGGAIFWGAGIPVSGGFFLGEGDYRFPSPHNHDYETGG